MKLSIKHAPIGKPLVNKGSILTYQWQAVSLSPAQIVQHITSGKPIAVGQYSEGHRNKKHFLQSDLIALDYDGNYSDDEYQTLIGSDFFRRYAFAIIQTASSKLDSRRCRVLFRLDQTITDRQDYADLVLFIISLAPEGADMGARDATRAFYGSKPGTVPDFFNPANYLNIAPFVEEIKQQRERVREARENRRDVELSGDFIRDIEKALGVTEYNADHWSNPVPCIMNHAHDDTRPAAYWNEDSHILYCFKCGLSYLAKDTARALGIEHFRASSAGDSDVDLSTTPDIQEEAPAYQLVALPAALRKAMIKDGLTNLCRLIDALLWEGFAMDKEFSRSDVVEVTEYYGLRKTAVFKLFDGFSAKINSTGRGESLPFQMRNKSGGRPIALYTLNEILAYLERLYSYSIFDAGDYLQDHLMALCSAKEYRMYAVLENIPDKVEVRRSCREIASDFNLSGGTISKYTSILKERGYLEVTTHFLSKEISMDMIGDMGARKTIKKWKKEHNNSHIAMYEVIEGVRIPYLHKGGKKRNPNNRIPPEHEVAMEFFRKSLKKKRVNGQWIEVSNLAFILTTRASNSYRRIAA